MRLRVFEKKMRRPVFTLAQAQIVAYEDSAQALRLALHRWAKKGEILRLRREVYAFPERLPSTPDLISVLYPPAYVSLESALNQHGLLPDVPFETTLATPRATRSFQTSLGRFHFHRVHPRLFFGYDSKTLMSTPEKALLDYFYFHGAYLKAQDEFWQEARFQHLSRVNWKKGDQALTAYPGEKVKKLWESLKRYAKTHCTD